MQQITEQILRRKGYRKLRSPIVDGKYNGTIFRKSIKNDDGEV